MSAKKDAFAAQAICAECGAHVRRSNMSRHRKTHRQLAGSDLDDAPSAQPRRARSSSSESDRSLSSKRSEWSTISMLAATNLREQESRLYDAAATWVIKRRGLSSIPEMEKALAAQYPGISRDRLRPLVCGAAAGVHFGAQLHFSYEGNRGRPSARRAMRSLTYWNMWPNCEENRSPTPDDDLPNVALMKMPPPRKMSPVKPRMATPARSGPTVREALDCNQPDQPHNQEPPTGQTSTGAAEPTTLGITLDERIATDMQENPAAPIMLAPQDQRHSSNGNGLDDVDESSSSSSDDDAFEGCTVQPARKRSKESVTASRNDGSGLTGEQPARPRASRISPIGGAEEPRKRRKTEPRSMEAAPRRRQNWKTARPPDHYRRGPTYKSHYRPPSYGHYPSRYRRN